MDMRWGANGLLLSIPRRAASPANALDEPRHARVDDWGAGIARAVRAQENEAAKAFIPIAASCR